MKNLNHLFKSPETLEATWTELDLLFQSRKVDTLFVYRYENGEFAGVDQMFRLGKGESFNVYARDNVNPACPVCKQPATILSSSENHALACETCNPESAERVKSHKPIFIPEGYVPANAEGVDNGSGILEDNGDTDFMTFFSDVEYIEAAEMELDF